MLCYVVYVFLQESKIKLVEVLVCDIILVEEYEVLGIFSNVFVVVGGWWVGYGEYIYVNISDGVLWFYIGGMGEEEIEYDGFQYVLLVCYEGDQF